MTIDKFNEVIKSIHKMLEDTSLKLEIDEPSFEYKDVVLCFVRRSDDLNAIEVTFDWKPTVHFNSNISLDITYSYDNIGDPDCDATPEEISLVKNIIKQIKKNEKKIGYCWDYRHD